MDARNILLENRAKKPPAGELLQIFGFSWGGYTPLLAATFRARSVKPKIGIIGERNRTQFDTLTVTGNG